jgi:hypothetical protein
MNAPRAFGLFSFQMMARAEATESFLPEEAPDKYR